MQRLRITLHWRRWTDALVAGATLIVVAGALVPKLSAGCVLAATWPWGFGWRVAGVVGDS
jgi:hypothetical protein